MTRKDYVLIAECLKFCKAKDTRSPEEMRQEIARTLSDAMREDNARFDQEHFLTACDVW